MRAASVILVILTMPFVMAFSKMESIAESNNYSAVTESPKFVQALNLMDGTSAEWAKRAILGENISHRPIKVLFKDLGKISQAYASFDALGWRGEDGQLYIFISKRHMNAPTEALASILSHESIHQDEFSSIEEETYGWCYEAVVWSQMKKKNPQLSNYNYGEDSLVDRLNTLEKMFKTSKNTDKEIRHAVSKNPGYSGLPAYSPGFDGNEEFIH
ncbi:MAG: hypothetical protein PHC34_10935 [Candidatus Gastranaerophilales bacterium]|nr:hypothetical protein [Candidatus Gastranaerophilales bacterium]